MIVDGIKVKNIVWDTDGEKVALPTTMYVPNMELEDIADYLSDRFGWCVCSLEVE